MIWKTISLSSKSQHRIMSWQFNQSETKDVKMPHLSIQGRDGEIGHHHGGVSVAQIFGIFNF